MSIKLRALLAVLAQNLNALVCALGFALLCLGVAGWSVPAAQVVAGLLLMVMAAWPYVRPTRKG